MHQSDSQRIRKSIIRFRRLALTSALVILLMNLWMVYCITTVLDHGSGAKIKGAGEQRLFAQRIRSDAFEIETAVRDKRWELLEPLFDELRTSSQSFRQGQTLLFEQSTPEELFPNATTEQHDLVASIAVPTRMILSASDELAKLTENTIRRSPYIDSQTYERIHSAKDEIIHAQSIFQPRMDQIVDLFEQQTRHEIDSSINHAKLGLFILVLMLGSTILFIIEPTILIIRRQLRDLDRAIKHAKRADAVRWRILTNMGHEFRTPMNAIMGFADLLKDQSLSETERARLSNSIYDSSVLLAQLIETLLDLSSIESGQIQIQPSKCDLHELLQRQCEQASITARAKQIQLNISIDESCPQEFITDAKRLEQVVENLLKNAVKFTQQGSVTLEARANPQDTLSIIVSDTGIGIPKEHLDSIFNHFNQSEDDLTRAYGGAGLGLAIARDLVRAMGGDIKVQSEQGKGSVFTMTLSPCQFGQDNEHAENEETVQPEPTTDPFHNARILIVDDAKDNRVLLQFIFKKTQAELEFAYEGQQAIDLVKEASAKNRPFDLILMDMQMPVLDGYSATQQLRQSQIQTPIIALTAHALEGDRQRCLAAGCDEYMSKPVDRAKLLTTCAALLKEPSPKTSHAA